MRRHELDLTSLIWGLLFLAAAGLAFLVEATDLNIDIVDLDGRWVVAVALLIVGGLGLATSLRRLGARDREQGSVDEYLAPDREFTDSGPEDR